MVLNKKLVKDWNNKTKILNARLCRALSNVVANAICAITLSTKTNNTLSAFVNFPIEDDIMVALYDANWGPQD